MPRILGFVYPTTGNVNSSEPLENLFRVSGSGKDDIYTTDFNEAQSLLASGYTSSTIIARAVALRGRDRFRDGQTCKGSTAIDTRVNDTTAGRDPAVVSGTTLVDLAVGCTLKRIAAGSALSASELAIRDKLALLDPAVVQYATDSSARLLTLSAAARATLLGPLAALDPAACTGPVDWPRIVGAADQDIHTNANGESQFGNGGTQQGTGISLVKLRAPQCQGVTYGSGDRGSVAEATKAVTATTQDILLTPDTCDGGENKTCIFGPAGRINPVVYGILTGGHTFPAGDALEQWSGISGTAPSHEEIGLPLAGIDSGEDCSAGCSQALGQACIDGKCRAFPMVENQTMLTISGANFWDLSTARVVVTRLSNGETFDAPVMGIDVKPIISNTEFPARCDQTPLHEGLPLGVADGPPVITCEPGHICPDPYVRDINPNEFYVEKLSFLLSLPDTMLNEFYTVQVVNANGSYIPRADVVPLDPAQLPTVGRTVHVCAPPACNPAPASDNAACALAAIPTCGGAVGGVWITPPRSLTECKAQLTTSGDPTFQCPETPFTFSSPKTTDGGAPIQFFVGTPQPSFVHPTLWALHCSDETGWDAAGDDELVVSMASVGVNQLAVGDLEASADVYRTDINAGDTFRPNRRFRSESSPLIDPTKQAFMIQVGEDDDIGVAMVFTAIVTTITGGVTGAVAPSKVGPLVGGLIGAGAGSITGILIDLASTDQPFFDPDDFIGSEGWLASSSDVATRGQTSHSAPIDSVPAFQGSGDARDLVGRQAGKHPGVDTVDVNLNSQLRACSSASDCTPSRPVCTAGACVPSRWTDRTLPGPFNPLTDFPGQIEHLQMNGDSTDYEVWISTTVSGTQ